MPRATPAQQPPTIQPFALWSPTRGIWETAQLDLYGQPARCSGWGVTLLVDSRYQEGTTRRDVIDTQEVHPGVQG